MRERHTLRPKAYARIHDYQGPHYHTSEFANIADYLKWKWNPDVCGVCENSRPRLDNFKNLAEDVNAKWLGSGMWSRDEAAKEISKELMREWRVTSLLKKDHGTRTRAKFQTRTQWDYATCKDKKESYASNMRKIQRFHQRSSRKVASRNFKISSDLPVGRTEHVAGIDRWRMHRLMIDNDLDEDDTLLGRPTTYFDIPSQV